MKDRYFQLSSSAKSVPICGYEKGSNKAADLLKVSTQRKTPPSLS
jgi:hypothetical protein